MAKFFRIICRLDPEFKVTIINSLSFFYLLAMRSCPEFSKGMFLFWLGAEKYFDKISINLSNPTIAINNFLFAIFKTKANLLFWLDCYDQ